ncbi:helix-turn-helix domain-containing protein [Azotobacter sp. CWF10]
MTAQQALLAYHWPGNIRQLYQVLRLAAALAEDEWEIDLKHLPEEIWDGHESKIERLAKIDTPQLYAGRTLQASGLCAIRSALEATGGNISAAARSLGIARATLYRKLKKLEQS